jgi:hypothetical protein
MMKALLPAGATVCEIGVFKGEFANMLLRLQPKKLVLIDPFIGKVFSGDADGNNGQEAVLPLVYLSLAQQTAAIPTILLLRGTSQELLSYFAPESFDAIYIDGDHSYEGVKRDLQIAWRIVKDGGYICGHDYETNPEKTKNYYDFGVKRAVDEFCKEKGVSICAKGLDGQVSFAIKKDCRQQFEYYIDYDTAKPFVKLGQKAKTEPKPPLP